MATPYGVPMVSGHETIQLGSGSKKIQKILLLYKKSEIYSLLILIQVFE